VLFASYSRVIVDEYQDCDPDQHAVVCHLATILPTVVLGEPMQEIFNWRGNHPDWDRDVVGKFPLAAELDLSRFCSGHMLMLGGPLFEGHW